jgi:hypothetical protein
VDVVRGVSPNLAEKPLPANQSKIEIVIESAKGRTSFSHIDALFYCSHGSFQRHKRRDGAVAVS